MKPYKTDTTTPKPKLDVQTQRPSPRNEDCRNVLQVLEVTVWVKVLFFLVLVRLVVWF